MIHSPTRLLRELLLGSLLSTAVCMTACAAPQEGEDLAEPAAAGQEGALGKNEYVTAMLIEAAPSLDRKSTGVDAWDIGVVSDGKDQYVVAMGFAGHARRTPVIEFVLPTSGLSSKTPPRVVARSPDPNKPLSLELDDKTLAAMGRDLEALKPELIRKIGDTCQNGLGFVSFMGAFVTMALAITAAGVCIAETAGVCALAIGATLATGGGSYLSWNRSWVGCPTK